MVDIIDIIQLDDFHASVEKLAEKQPVSLFGRIYRRITHWSLTESNKANAAMMNLVTQQALVILTKYDVNHFSSLAPILQENLLRFKEDLNRLFKEIYPSIEENPFSKDNKLPKSIQEYFSEDIKILRAEKMKNHELNHDPEHRLKRKIAKGEQFFNFRRDTETSKGATGTLKVLDINNKPVGMFKVSDEYIPIVARIVNYIKSWFGQLSYLSRKYMAQPKSERAAFLLSRILELDLVPPSSKEMLLQNKVGIFQIFISREKKQGLLGEVKNSVTRIKESAEGQVLKNIAGKREDAYFEAVEITNFINQKTEFTEEESYRFQKFAIFDYLIGNLDRHQENWFVTMSYEGVITNIKAIDNANAFPKKQPKKGSLAARNQYKWKSLKISNQKFTPQAIEFVKQKLVPEKIDEYLTELNQDLPDFLDADMEGLFKMRAEVIRKLVLESENTPASLASYSTKEEMEKFLK